MAETSDIGSGSAKPRTTSPPKRWSQLLVLLGLWGFAVTQPLLALLGDEPAFFISRRSAKPAILLFVLTVAVVPPVALWLLGRAVQRVHAGAGRWFHLGAVGILVALATLPVVRSIGIQNATLMVVAAAALGAAFAYAYARFDVVAAWARFTAILPVLSVFVFLVASPTGALVRSSSGAVDELADSNLPPVVFLMLDEFPTMSLLDDGGNIDQGRFPNLAAFAGAATWYRNNTAVATSTEQAIPAILSGRAPTQDKPLAQNHPDTLFTLLAPTHKLVVSESLTALCALPSCRTDAGPGLAEQARSMASGSAELWLKRVTPGPLAPADRGDFAESVEFDSVQPRQGFAELYAAPTRFDEFLKALTPGERPVFGYLHLVLPHQPWRFGPDGRTYDAADFPKPVGETYDEPWLMALEQQRHLFQAQFADALVGRLLAQLRAQGLYDKAIVVVMADHGVAFEPGADLRLLHDTKTVPQIGYAPLFIKRPGQTQGGVDDQNVMAVDVVPTVAQLAGRPVSWPTDGTPIGSPEMAARGGHKAISDFGSLLYPQAATKYDFDMAATRPEASDRWIGPSDPDGSALAPLLDPLAVDRWLGQDLDQVVTGTGGSTSLAHTAVGQTQALVRGTLDDPPADGRVLVAVDGKVVSASPLVTVEGRPGSFITLIPPDLVNGTPRSVRVALVPGPRDAGSPQVLALQAQS